MTSNFSILIDSARQCGYNRKASTDSRISGKGDSGIKVCYNTIEKGSLVTESQDRDLEEFVLYHAVILSLCVTLGKTIHVLGSCPSYL